MTPPAQLPNLRPLVAEVLREALDALPEGDASGVAAKIRRRMSGQRQTERLRFETTLAWTAAVFASHLTAEQREQGFAVLEASDEALAVAFARAAVLMLLNAKTKEAGPDDSAG